MTSLETPSVRHTTFLVRTEFRREQGGHSGAISSTLGFGGLQGGKSVSLVIYNIYFEDLNKLNLKGIVLNRFFLNLWS